MSWARVDSRRSLVVVAVLIVLLAVLASLQYRWIARLSEAERERLEARRDAATAALCDDFDREVTRAFVTFSLDQPRDDTALERLLGNRLRTWRASGSSAALVRDVFVIRRRPDREVELLCFDESTTTLHGCEWQPDLIAARGRLHATAPGGVLDGVLPGLLIAVNQPGAEGGGEGGEAWRPPRDHLVVRFDLQLITSELLPRLVADRFAELGVEYSLTVAHAGQPDQVVFRSGPPPASTVRAGVSRGTLFGLRVDPAHVPSRAARAPGRPGTGRPGSLLPPPGQRPLQGRLRPEPGQWVLEVRSPAGSLEDVVAHARWRNLALSLAILAMLGATMLMLVTSSRRAQRLARQQLDFVAAVSHELRTPLTAIRSAGQNLADGIIDEPERVRSYGLLIEREGRRLTEMIGRVLSFAGIRSGQQNLRMAPVAVAETVTAVLEDCRWVLEERGFEVTCEIAAELPAVTGDAAALRQVVGNLVDNAIKYGAAGRWLGVAVEADPGPTLAEVRIVISDHGPGIPKRERAEVFEPFRRGAGVASGPIPGSGLGLAVVRSIVAAHGGRVEVGSPPGGGAVVTVRLPAAAPGSDGSG